MNYKQFYGDIHCVCLEARQTRLPFHNSMFVSASIFDLIHADIWGPNMVPTVIGVKYFLTIIEDKSRATRTYFLEHKGQAMDYLIKFILTVETQFDTKAKKLRTDNGKEFLCRKLKDFLDIKGIIHQRSCTYSHQQNGIVEHKTQTSTRDSQGTQA